jgi:hypothetical protein
MLEVLISLVIFGSGVVAAEGQTGKPEFSIERVGHREFCRELNAGCGRPETNLRCPAVAGSEHSHGAEARMTMCSSGSTHRRRPLSTGPWESLASSATTTSEPSTCWSR